MYFELVNISIFQHSITVVTVLEFEQESQRKQLAANPVAAAAPSDATSVALALQFAVAKTLSSGSPSLEY